MKARAVVFLVFLITVSICLINTQPVTATEATENSWMSMASMPTARAYLGVAVVNGKIYAIGGDASSETGIHSTPSILNVTEEYNPNTNSWITRTPMPTRRGQFGTVVYSNKIYCIGGSGHGLSANEAYDPATDTWTTKAPTPVPIGIATANIVNGKIYAIHIGGSPSPMNVYDPVADTWTNRTSTPPCHIYSEVSAVIGNEIYFLGWIDASTNRVIAYNTSNDSWRTITGLPDDRTWAYGDCGGLTTGVKSPVRFYDFNPLETDIFDPSDNSWTVGMAMPSSLYHAGVAVINDTFYVLGGRTEGVGVLPFTISYYPNSANQKYTPFLFGAVPYVSISSPVNMTTYATSNVSIHFSVNSKTTWMGYSLDGQANITVSENTYNASLINLSEGKHELTVCATNYAGDVTSATTVYFTVDMTPPNVTLLSPVNKTYGSTDVQLEFAVNEKTSWIGYRLDSYANVTITGNTTLTRLPYGPHNVTVYAKDTAGYTSASETVYFTVVQQTDFLDSSLPMEYGYAAVSMIGVAIVAVIGYLLYKRRK